MKHKYDPNNSTGSPELSSQKPMQQTSEAGLPPITDPKIKAARITAMPQRLMDPMPQVIVQLNDEETEQVLFSFYPDEIMFLAHEFIGLTLKQTHQLKYERDNRYLQS